MAVGASPAITSCFGCIEGMPILVAFILGGICAAMVGMCSGCQACASAVFYLAVATLATQFFIVWCLTKVPWFTNNSSSGVITAQQIEILGFKFDSPQEKYLLVLGIVAVMALMAKNMVRSTVGRSWMAVRDMDVAAEVIGFRIMRNQADGVRGQLVLLRCRWRALRLCYLGTVEPEVYNLDVSFRILFMVIIGG